MFIALSLNVVIERMLVQYYNKRSSDGAKVIIFHFPTKGEKFTF